MLSVCLIPVYKTYVRFMKRSTITACKRENVVFIGENDERIIIIATHERFCSYKQHTQLHRQSELYVYRYNVAAANRYKHKMKSRVTCNNKFGKYFASFSFPQPICVRLSTHLDQHKKLELNDLFDGNQRINNTRSKRNKTKIERNEKNRRKLIAKWKRKDITFFHVDRREITCYCDREMQKKTCSNLIPIVWSLDRETATETNTYTHTHTPNYANAALHRCLTSEVNE